MALQKALDVAQGAIQSPTFVIVLCGKLYVSSSFLSAQLCPGGSVSVIISWVLKQPEFCYFVCEGSLAAWYRERRSQLCVIWTKTLQEARQRKYMVHTHTHTQKQAGCQHVVISWRLTRQHANNIKYTVLEVLAFINKVSLLILTYTSRQTLHVGTPSLLVAFSLYYEDVGNSSVNTVHSYFCPFRDCWLRSRRVYSIWVSRQDRKNQAWRVSTTLSTQTMRPKWSDMQMLPSGSFRIVHFTYTDRSDAMTLTLDVRKEAVQSAADGFVSLLIASQTAYEAWANAEWMGVCGLLPAY